MIDGLSGMTAVVTGSSGFIGQHLVAALLARGAVVRVLQRPESRPAVARERLAVFRCDLRDAEALRRAAVWERATHCFHLAGRTQAVAERAFSEGNVTPTMHLCAALASRGAEAPRLLYVSSQAAAGPAVAADRPVREDDVPRPLEGYGRSKLEAEAIVERHRDRFATTVVRPAAVYGPGDRDFLALFRQALTRWTVLPMPHTHRISVVHVHDLVRGLIAAATSAPAIGRRYFLAHHESASWGSIAAAIAAEGGRRTRTVALPAFVVDAAALVAESYASVSGRDVLVNRHKVALSRPPWWLCDPSRAADELGWRATIGVTAGVRETLTWYRDSGWISRHG